MQTGPRDEVIDERLRLRARDMMYGHSRDLSLHGHPAVPVLASFAFCSLSTSHCRCWYGAMVGLGAVVQCEANQGQTFLFYLLQFPCIGLPCALAGQGKDREAVERACWAGYVLGQGTCIAGSDTGGRLTLARRLNAFLASYCMLCFCPVALDKRGLSDLEVQGWMVHNASRESKASLNPALSHSEAALHV